MMVKPGDRPWWIKQTNIIMVKPGGSGAASVDVDVDPIALVRGRHEHVLTRVVAWMITLKCNHKVKVRLNLTKKKFSINFINFR